MKIGFDAKRLFNNFTGLGNYSRFVVDALSANYPANDYFLYTPKLRSHPETSHYLDTKRFTVRQPEGKPGALWRTFSITDDLRNDKLEIFHGLSNELPFRKPAGIRTVITVHDLIFLRFPEYYGMIDVAIYKWKLAHSCKSADVVIAVSQQTATDLQEFLGVDPKKIVVVYQGCHPSFYQKVSNEAIEAVRRHYELPEEFILYVGTLEKRKNAGLIIKALARMKNRIPVVFAGRPTKYIAELEGLVKKYQAQAWVKFVYNASFADLPAFYQAASLFIYPSVFEGFGIPIVEAIASGVPVITSNGSCFSEAGGPDCIYVNPSNPEELCDAVTMVLENGTLRSTMVDASGKYINKFAPGVIAGELTKVYGG
ncbi:MAG TPA: glycosyltransferase family 1 protein [Cyclobacteriaceae bacterium]|nr:glycosyltransferase family 1 protein [Cyclobacteriaceae bacterium]